LHDHLRRIGSEAINHFVNGVGDDAELRAFPTGMDEADGRRCRIDDVNRATVGNVNAESDTAFVRDNAVARGEFAARRAAATAVDRGDFVSVNLFRGKQRPLADTDCVANFSMGSVEPLQDLGLVM